MLGAEVYKRLIDVRLDRSFAVTMSEPRPELDTPLSMSRMSELLVRTSANSSKLGSLAAVTFLLYECI